MSNGLVFRSRIVIIVLYSLMDNHKKILRIIAIIFAMLLCCSCDKIYDPQIPYGLLLKCRDFLAFCLFLADQEKPYYNHIAQRYYYAMLALASITFQWRKGNGERFVLFSKHEEVWGMLPIDVRDYYGRTLKSLRTKCDYHHDKQSRDQETFKNELSTLVHNGDIVLKQLEEQTRVNYEKFFGPSVTDDSIKKEDCDALMEEINELNESLKGRL